MSRNQEAAQQGVEAAGYQSSLVRPGSQQVDRQDPSSMIRSEILGGLPAGHIYPEASRVEE